MMQGYEHFKSKDWHSPSGLCKFSRCPRMYFYGSGCRLRKPSTHCALEFGQAMHKAFPVATTEGPQASIETFNEAWGDTIGDDKRNPDRAAAILGDFALRQKPYELMKAPQSKLKADTGEWEIPFALDIGCSKPMMGKIDGWGRNTITGKPCGVEYKTTAWGIGGMFFESFRRNPQILTYDLVLKEFDKEMEGVMLEGIFVGKNEKNLCQPIWTSEYEVEQLVDWIKWMDCRIQDCEQKQLWPQNFAACNSYSWFWNAGFNCDFLDLCQSHEWAELLDLYVVNDEKPFWIEE